MEVSLKSPLKGQISIPGDKSISHRAVMIGSLAEGTTRISGFLTGEDCISTANAFRKLGSDVSISGTDVLIYGLGLHNLKAPSKVLDMGNSGTTTRLISGILAAQPFTSEISGDASLNSRPMARIIKPLSQMGAKITSRNGNNCAPLIIEGTKLHGIHYDSPVASAQVKSCILLAGLYAEGETSVTEPFLSRNHTENMLPFFGATLRSEGTTATVSPCAKLTGGDITVPGDISTAAYYLTAAVLTPGSEITLTNVGINETRAGLLNVLLRMGANLKIENRRVSGGEEIADITASYSQLTATDIMPEEIPSLVDEVPILAIAAAAAEGKTTFYNVAELRAKECDRLDAMEEGLNRIGVRAHATEDTLIVEGTENFRSAMIDTRHDHRIAMSFAVASLLTKEPMILNDTSCIAISCPTFFDLFQKLEG